jgi:hypothetical protein
MVIIFEVMRRTALDSCWRTATFLLRVEANTFFDACKAHGDEVLLCETMRSVARSANTTSSTDGALQLPWAKE